MTQQDTTQTNSTGSKPARSGRSGWLVFIGAILAAIIFGCVNILGANLFRSARVDMTEQNLFSLSNGTRQLVKSIDEPIRFRFFLSSQLTKEAPQLAAFAQRVRSMLESYVAESNGKIVLEIIDPKPFSEDEDRAVAFGIRPYRASTGDRVFFGLAATNSTDGSAKIATFSPEREQFLEYDLTRLVAELGRRGKPVLALIDGLGLYGNPRLRQPPQQIIVQMQQFFDVKPQVGDVDKLPDDTKIVLVVHPQSLSDRTRYTLDQWVLNGGATMIFVDPKAEHQIGFGGRPPADPSSDLPKLFKAWGVKYDKKKAVADLAYAFKANRTVDGRPVTMINLPWLALRKSAFNTKLPILSQLQALVMTTAGSFSTAKKDVTITPLISGSDQGGLLDVAKIGGQNTDLRALINEIKQVDGKPVMAARLSGKLDSAFKAKPKDSKFEGKHIAKGAKDSNVILVADADMLMDRNWVQKRNIMGSTVAQAFANNGDFLMNALEQMAGGTALTDLRGRGVAWRPFLTIQKMEAEASKKYSAKEQQLTQKLKETEQKLTQLSKAGTQKDASGKEVLSKEQIAAIEKFKTDLLATREELRKVQYSLRSEVDQLKSWITAINVGGVPLLAGAIALLFAMRRPRRSLPKKSGKPAAGAGAPGPDGDNKTA